jgi:soluble lytic murein transglycosylase-like protein
MVLAGTLLASGHAGAQVFRIVDQEGVVHFTNNPCDPRYVRLDPSACPAPEPAATAAVTPADSSAGVADLATRIESTAMRHGVDHRLVAAVVRVESGGNPRAISPKGARGLMQLMPARAAALGVQDAFDPAENLDGGIRHLKDLLARYGGNLRLALAAYNAGEDAVQKYGGVPPYRETQEYVRKILQLYTPDPTPKPAAVRPGPRPAL